ncbi:MAG: hypothetical protein R2932_08850 [Caldilineaceae bacterium]
MIVAQQEPNSETFEIDPKEYERHLTHKVRGVNKELAVSVPQDTHDTVEAVPTKQLEIRESFQIQALLAHIGSQMGLNIWMPRNDRTAVMTEWKSNNEKLLELLPLNYDEATLKTIEQIDVIWLKGRSIVRAFEVEHTTSIYSGILRMADLLALQPNAVTRSTASTLPTSASTLRAIVCQSAGLASFATTMLRSIRLGYFHSHPAAAPCPMSDRARSTTDE